MSTNLKHSSGSPDLTWVAVGRGQISIGHRPRLGNLYRYHEQGATHILTLLAESEGAQKIGDAVRAAGMDWIWLPMKSAKPPHHRVAEVRERLSELAVVLAAGAKLHIHCSAGIHRTGMICWALLRYLGLSNDATNVALRALRGVTAHGVGQHRIAWADQFGSDSSFTRNGSGT